MTGNKMHSNSEKHDSHGLWPRLIFPPLNFPSPAHFFGTGLFDTRKRTRNTFNSNIESKRLAIPR
jgi:hypothetical protein